MSLDLHQTATQIAEMASHLRRRQLDWRSRLQTGLATLASADAPRLEAKRQVGKVTWLVAGATNGLAPTVAPPPLPASYTVVAVDGSHIDVDRHSPARCFLINIGLCHLTYGPRPGARLSSHPTLYAADDDLVLADPSSQLNRSNVEGPLLGLVRTVAEVEALADALEALPSDLPVLGLVDGSLILWGLAGQAQPDFVKRRILDDGLLPALDRLQRLAASRPLAIAAYISLPGNREVVNLLRLHHCPYQPANCDLHCKQVPPGQRGCDPVDGLLD
ncbi:MAG: DNA double-strand break repair nuclease NurA, partial [Chloroflexi bacterium]|nr:DNA double-strand break repair nuclease NurA [Chloroflexota bacterium]